VLSHPAPGVVGSSFIGFCAFFLNRNGLPAEPVVLQEKHTGTGHRPEIVPPEQLERLMSEAVQAFYGKLGTHPSRVIFYRDGVADSQFSGVHEHEILGAKNAFHSFGMDATELVFIVAQKRNAARLFRVGQDGRVPGGQDGAPRPGTVVDTDIVSHEFDFYLQGAYALKGTPHPVHYHVLRNDPQLSSDELQRFTFDLCHLYERCTKSVSLPAPLMWAHIAAFKAPFLAQGYREQTGDWLETVSSSSGASGTAASNAAVMRTVPEWEKRRLGIA